MRQEGTKNRPTRLAGIALGLTTLTLVLTVLPERSLAQEKAIVKSGPDQTKSADGATRQASSTQSFIKFEFPVNRSKRSRVLASRPFSETVSDYLVVNGSNLTFNDNTGGGGSAAFELDGAGGISSVARAGWATTTPLTRFRLTRPTAEPTPLQAYPAPFLITPYQYGWAFEYPGTAEWWVGSLSVHYHPHWHECSGCDPAKGAEFWVGDTTDTGGFYMTSRNYGGSVWSEISNEMFNESSPDHGDFRLRVPVSTDAFSFRVGGRSSSTEVVRITGGGNVGIGTASPGGLFEIWKTTSPAMYVTRDSSGGSGKNQTIAIGIDGSAGRSYIDSTHYSSGGYPLDFRVRSNTYMTVDVGGNVGIGTTSPGSKLQVNGGNIIVGSAGQGILLKSPNGSVCKLLTIDNSGQIALSSATCP